MSAAAASSKSFLAVHLWHVVAAAVFLVVALGIAAFADRREAARRGGRGRADAGPAGQLRAVRQVSAPRRALILCVVASVGAAGIHFAVMPEHFEESALYGSFFAVVATVQLAWSATVALVPDRRLLLAGAGGNAAVVLLWLVTRLVAIPLGPAAGTTEAFGALDVLASMLELLVVLAAIPLVRRRTPPVRHPVPLLLRSRLLLGGLALAAGVVTVTALVAPPS